jgi:hypothetical protein
MHNFNTNIKHQPTVYNDHVAIWNVNQFSNILSILNIHYKSYKEVLRKCDNIGSD